MSKVKRKIYRDKPSGEFRNKQAEIDNPDGTTIETISAVSVADAAKVLAKALREDKEFYSVYQTNIAAAFYDEAAKTGLEFTDADAGFRKLYAAAKTGAKSFLDLFISASAATQAADNESETLADTYEEGDERVD